MPLTTEERQDAARKLIRRMFVDANQTAQLDTVDVRNLIDDVDDYLEANAQAINQAIRGPLRSKATAAQKALAVAWVALKRAGAL